MIITHLSFDIFLFELKLWFAIWSARAVHNCYIPVTFSLRYLIHNGVHLCRSSRCAERASQGWRVRWDCLVRPTSTCRGGWMSSWPGEMTWVVCSRSISSLWKSKIAALAMSSLRQWVRAPLRNRLQVGREAIGWRRVTPRWRRYWVRCRPRWTRWKAFTVSACRDIYHERHASFVFSCFSKAYRRSISYIFLNASMLRYLQYFILINCRIQWASIFGIPTVRPALKA